MTVPAFPSVWSDRQVAGSRAGDGDAPAGVVSATVADHAAACQFLAGIFHGDCQEEFRASLEDPFYSPRNRLLVRHGSLIVTHVCLARRMMRFGSVMIPAAQLGWLGTALEFRGQGHAAGLLAAAERQMSREGAPLGVLWTRIPQFFHRFGWVPCSRSAQSRAAVPAILAAMSARGLGPRRGKPLNIRPWRQIELDALVRIYNQNTAAMLGPFQRTQSYWKWLIRRKGYGQILVAIDGPDRLEIAERNSPIVGYAVTRGDSIVELFTAPGHPTAAVELLVRICRDAVEEGRCEVYADAPPNSRLHKLLRMGGGSYTGPESGRGETVMAKVINPIELVAALGGRLRRRAEAAGLARPLELGFAVDGRPYDLRLSTEAAEFTSGGAAPRRVSLGGDDFTRMLLGHLDWKQAMESGRVHGTSPRAVADLRALFPRRRAWYPPLDGMPARE